MSSSRLKELFIVDYNHVNKDFDSQRDLLSKQIANIELRQQEIQLHMAAIEAANQHLDLLIRQEQDKRKKASYYSARLQNIEILGKLFSIYREFEDVKFKYHSNVSDLIYKIHKLIEVDIKKANKNIDENDLGEVFKKLLTMNSDNNIANNQIQNEVLDDIKLPEYQL